MILSEKKQLAVFINESLNHPLNSFVQNTDSFREIKQMAVIMNKLQMICSALILSEKKQVAVFESLNHSFNRNTDS